MKKYVQYCLLGSKVVDKFTFSAREEAICMPPNGKHVHWPQ